MNNSTRSSPGVPSRASVIPLVHDWGVTTCSELPVSNGLSDVADERLEAELCQGAADLAAGMAKWLGLVAEYDRRRVWAQWECRSGSPVTSASPWSRPASTSRSRTRSSACPLVAAEFAKGRLSYSRVRALCRFVTPELEADMVEMARFATAAQLERMAAGVERAKRQNELWNRFPTPPASRTSVARRGTCLRTA